MDIEAVLVLVYTFTLGLFLARAALRPHPAWFLVLDETSPSVAQSRSPASPAACQLAGSQGDSTSGTNSPTTSLLPTDLLRGESHHQPGTVEWRVSPPAWVCGQSLLQFIGMGPAVPPSCPQLQLLHLGIQMIRNASALEDRQHHQPGKGNLDLLALGSVPGSPGKLKSTFLLCLMSPSRGQYRVLYKAGSGQLPATDVSLCSQPKL